MKSIPETGAGHTSGLKAFEAEVWKSVGPGWKPLFGRFKDVGVSFEWHDFEATETFDWARSFHSGSTEICLNLSGHGTVAWEDRVAAFGPMTAGFYCRGNGADLRAERPGSERHRFITVEISAEFLGCHLTDYQASLHPLARRVLEAEEPPSGVGPVEPMTAAQRELVRSFRSPPVSAAAQRLWYETKAIELSTQILFRPDGEEFFCTRQHRLSRERADRVMEILRANLAEPPTLEQMGREVGCSHYHLSRIFSTETGQTIPQYLRQLRMQRAAELLRTGQCNVTEAALEVGYSSLSHFSSAFHDAYGCCPGLYPQQTPSQRRRRDDL